MITKSLRQGFINSWSTIKFVASIVLPVMFVVMVLEEVDIVSKISHLLEPAMQFFSLDGDSALTILLGNFINIYAAIATFSTVVLSQKELTIVAIMLLISHSQITEGFIFKRLGVSVTYIIMVRVISSVVIGLIVSVIL